MLPIYEKEQSIVKMKNEVKALEAYLKQACGHEEIHRVEENIFDFVKNIGRHALQSFIDESGSGYEKDNAPLDSNGGTMRYKIIRHCDYQSIFGKVRIPRAGYHDTVQQRYYFPTDSQLNLPQSMYSYLLTDWLLACASETDYRRSVEIINKIFGLDLSHTVSKRLCAEVAEGVDSFYEKIPAPPEETEGTHIAISADGKGVPIKKSEESGAAYRAETPKARLAKGEKFGRKKESIVTLDYSFNPASRSAEEIVQALMKEYQNAGSQVKKETPEQPEPPRLPLNKLQRATLSGKDAAMDDLMQRLQRRDPDGKKLVIVLIDGAPALENALKRAIARSGFEERIDVMILDIIHVTEYVWEAGTAIFGEKSDKRQPWVREKLLNILEGKTGYVIGALTQVKDKNKKLSKSKIETLEKAITYLTNHKHMMVYDQYLAKGYPIGTGVVESACGSLVKNRMERNGMRWTLQGAQDMLDIRAVKLNGHWDEFVEKFVSDQKIKLYADDCKYKRKKAA